MKGLVHFGILEYSAELLKRLEEKSLFQSGEEAEVEIRGCSIWSVEV